jgi:Prenyltransferase and squalene oxidase repeat
MADGAALEEGRRRLELTEHPGGGWGYRVEGQFFVEPTSLALLAFAPLDPSPNSATNPTIERALEALLSCQRADGFFGTNKEDPDASWSTAPALLALVAHGRSASANSAGEWLAHWQVPESPPTEEARKEVERLLRIDLALPGWPWQAGEGFATVEPTSLAAIALRAWGGGSSEQRIEGALRYLVDRACPSGGWNYGNPYFFEDELPPVTLPTAKALLALLLCGESRGSALVARSAAALSRLLESNPSRKAHAWGALVFAALGDRPRAGVHARAATDSLDGKGPWGGGPGANALALLALRAAGGEAPRCLSRAET